jgi:hypothetical protein
MDFEGRVIVCRNLQFAHIGVYTQRLAVQIMIQVLAKLRMCRGYETYEQSCGVKESSHFCFTSGTLEW